MLTLPEEPTPTLYNQPIEANRALPLHDAILQEVFEYAPDGIVVVDENGRITHLNAQIEAMFGHNRADLLGQPVELLLPERFREQHVAHRADYILEPHHRPMGASLELFARHKNGSEFAVDIMLSPLQTTEGKWTIAAVRDVTARKQIWAERSQLAAIVEFSEDAIISKTLDGSIVSWNRGAQHIYGYSADEMKGKTISILVPPELPDDLPLILETIRQGGVVEHYETVRMRKDGQRIHVSLAVSPVKNPLGRVVGAAVVARDITGRKKIEEALRESETKLRAIFEILPVGVTILDQNRMIVDLNPAVEKILGITKEGLLQGDYQNRRYLREDGTTMLPSEFPGNQALNEGKVISNTEMGVVKEDGATIWTSVSAAPLSVADLGVAIVTTDITERKQAEAQIRAALKEKEAMLKEIHHRVKNNLQTISSLLNLQARYIQDTSTQAIFRESQSRVKAMALVHETLYQSKDLAHIDFARYVQQLIRYLANAYGIQSSSLTIELDVEKIHFDVDTAVSCGLVINELVSNALKYAFPVDKKSGSEVYIGLHLEIADQIRLIIKDNGIGFPVDLDFRQTETLGLQLVNTLVTDELNGTINLIPDNGTTFIISFPKIQY